MRLSPVNRQILAIGIPSIVTNITTPLLALVDTAIVGHMGSAVYIAAIAVGGSVFNMLYWLFGFLRMGSSGMTAQAWGKRDKKETDRILQLSLILSLCGSSVIILFQLPIIDLILRFMQTDAMTSDLVRQYFSILVYGAPAVLMTYSLTGWFIGMQDWRSPMWISFIINIVNICVSLVLVLILKCGIKGVATGTLVAQLTGCVIGLIMTRRHRFSFKGTSLNSILSKPELKRFFSVNVDIFLRTLCLITVTVWFTRIGARQGSVMLAVNTLLMQFFVMFSYFMDGFAFSGEALAGRYIGARDREKLTTTVKSLFKIAAAIALIFTILYAAGGTLILNMLSDNREVTDAAGEFRWWAVTIPVAGFSAFAWDGIFIGATQTRSMLISMAIAMTSFFVILHLLYPSLGNHALWLAFIVYLLLRGLILAIEYIIWLKRVNL